jgi:small subunit ribosomal protein S18
MSDRGDRGDRGGDREEKGGGGRLSFRRRKYCKFCEEKIAYIDYKDVELLAAYVPERAKLAPRRISGTCAAHQRKLQTAVKQARNIALLPFTTE